MKPEFFQGALDVEQPYRPENNEVDHYFKSPSILDKKRGGEGSAPFLTDQGFFFF